MAAMRLGFGKIVLSFQMSCHLARCLSETNMLQIHTPPQIYGLLSITHHLSISNIHRIKRQQISTVCKTEPAWCQEGGFREQFLDICSKSTLDLKLHSIWRAEWEAQEVIDNVEEVIKTWRKKNLSKAIKQKNIMSYANNPWAAEHRDYTAESTFMGS